MFTPIYTRTHAHACDKGTLTTFLNEIMDSILLCLDILIMKHLIDTNVYRIEASDEAQ